MIKIRKTIFFLLGISLIVGCKKYEIQYDGAYDDSMANPSVNLPKNIAYIKGNDVFLTDEWNAKTKKLTNSPTVIKTKIAINRALSKIAYKSGNTITVIDSSGNVIQTTPANYIDDFNWTDSGLLYGANYNTDRVEAIYGTLPTGLPQPTLIGTNSSFKLLAAYITTNNGLIYGYNKTNGTGGLAYKQTSSSTYTVLQNEPFDTFKADENGTAVFASYTADLYSTIKLSIGSSNVGTFTASYSGIMGFVKDDWIISLSSTGLYISSTKKTIPPPIISFDSK